MAVPPAPDGQAVGATSDSDDRDPDTGGRPTRARQWALVALVAVALVSLLVTAYFAFVRLDDPAAAFDEEAAPQTRRDQVMAVAKTFATQVATYGPDDLDEQDKMPEYSAGILELLTPRFATSFERDGLPLAEQSVAQQQITRSAQVYATGVSELTDDTARVLVAGTQQFAIPNPKKPEQLVPIQQGTFRFEVALVRTDGEWLVDDYGPAGTLDGPSPEELEQPTEAPSEAPSDETTPPRPRETERDRPRDRDRDDRRDQPRKRGDGR